MTKIPYGCVFLARKIQDNPIWYQKPAWWLKVFEYIFMQANHKEKLGFKRGQCFLNREQIYRYCHLQHEGVTISSVDNVIRYLRQQSILTTQQTTRGFIVTICNYDFYQNLDNYKNEAENEVKTKQKRSENEPINKNVKNVKNEKNKYIYSKIYEKWNSYNKFPQHKLKGRIGNRIKNEINKLLKDGESEIDICTTINNYAKIIHSEKGKYYFSHIWNLDEFLKRGYNKFKNWEIAHNNYLNKKKKSIQSEKDIDTWVGGLSGK